MGEPRDYTKQVDRAVTKRVDVHLEQALEASDDEGVNYHLREALGLLRI